MRKGGRDALRRFFGVGAGRAGFIACRCCRAGVQLAEEVRTADGARERLEADAVQLREELADCRAHEDLEGRQ